MPGKNLKLIQTKGSGLPLICVQFDGARRILPPNMGKDRPIYNFIHQGGDGKKVALDTIGSIADHYLSELKADVPTGPYLLVGYSFGGLVAYEMAQRLVHAGDRVPFLALIDCYAPHLHNESMKHGQPFYAPLKSAVIRKLVNHKLAKGGILTGKMRQFHIINTYHKAVLAYTAEPFIGRLTLFKSQESWGPPDLGWKGLVTGGLDVQQFQGDHASMLREPNVEELVRALKMRIASLKECDLDPGP
ncbi:MAG: hypothetical protein IPI81_06485 [Flavobacteriales bacterium]|nr:hypothetical protein [Flavobacteriales bacterium]MCC6937273.1 hypothetical protein [Flavobacteriales bacterium]